MSFDEVADPKTREILQSLPTSLALPAEAIDHLIAAGAQVLRDAPQYRALVESVKREP